MSVRTVVIALAIVAGLVVTASMLARGYVWQEGVDCLVYSHNGELVLEAAGVVQYDDAQAAFVSKQPGRIVIPESVASSGGEILVTGPGCGLFRAKVGHMERIALPPPIRLVVDVPEDYPLPGDDSGILLMLRSEESDPDVAAVLERGPVAANYWQEPTMSRSKQIWVDPRTRSATVLLPCTGRWRIIWAHTPRSARGISVVFGTGECEVQVAVDGQHTVMQMKEDEMTGIMEPDR